MKPSFLEGAIAEDEEEEEKLPDFLEGAIAEDEEEEPLPVLAPRGQEVKPVSGGFKEEVQTEINDILSQFLKGFAQGAGGTYGNILDIAGLQGKGPLPGQKLQFQREAEENLEGLPEKEKLDKLIGMTEEPTPIPHYGRLPTGREVGSFIEELGGPKRGKSPLSRMAARTGEMIGGGTALASPGVIPSIVAGGVGQGVEEMGGGPVAQAVGEILATIATLRNTGRTPTAANPEIQKRLDEISGFGPEAATLLKNALEERGFLEKISHITPTQERRFTDFLGDISSSIENILENSFPGIGQGVKALREKAGDLFDKMNEVARSVIVKKPREFITEIDNTIAELKRTLGNTPEEKQVIALLQDARTAALRRHYPVRFKEEISGRDRILEMLDRETDKVIGYISYDVDVSNSVINIHYFNVPREFKHTGYSILLLDELANQNPFYSIQTGLLSGQGKKFLSGLFERELSATSGNLLNLEEIAKIQQKAARFKERLTPIDVPADFYTNFYKGLNSIGKWRDPGQREFVYTKVKDAIKKTFRAQGKNGQKLGNMFDESNTQWRRMRQAEDVMEILERFTTNEGIDFARLWKWIEKPGNFKEFAEALGQQNASRFRQVVQAASDVRAFQKRLEGSEAKKLLGVGKLWELLRGIATLNLDKIGTVAGVQFAQRLSGKLLTEPKYQNLYIQLVDAVKAGKYQAAAILAMRIQDELQSSIDQENKGAREILKTR